MLDWKLKSGEPGIICKLDTEKAFNQLNWSYLIALLRRMGFGEVDQIDQIQHHGSEILHPHQQESSGILLSLERPTEKWSTIAISLHTSMDGLSRLLHWLNGFDVGRSPGNSVNISHLPYADDTLLFCGVIQIRCSTWTSLCSLLRLHQDYTSTCSNILYPVNEVPNLGDLAEIICCNTGLDPSQPLYLGLPLGAKFKVVDSWNGVVESLKGN